MAQLELLKARLEINPDDKSQDKLLNQLLSDAQAEILDFCNRDTLLSKMEGIQRELAIVYYNRKGSEGENSRSEGGVSVSYSTDIPDSIKRRLTGYRRLKAVSIANENTK
jgi:hypothetical protein